MSHELLAEGLRLLDAGQVVAALQAIEQAAQDDPSSPEVRQALALALLAVGSSMSRAGAHEQAAPVYRRAAEADPSNADAWANLGATYAATGRHPEAIAALTRATDADPGHMAARRNLGVVLKASGDFPAARRALAPLVASASTVDEAALAALIVPPIAQSTAQIAEDREGYAEGLEAIRRRPSRLSLPPAPFGAPTFPLAYHGLDDRVLAEQTAMTLSAKVEGLSYAAPGLSAWRRPSGRARVVFASDFLWDHTIGLLYRGVIALLDRRLFEVIVAHGPGSVDDEVRRSVDSGADGAIQLPADIAGQRRAIEALRPDLLFYPDIGMSGAMYLLAFSRLAPVQAVGWGHPDTTGLPSIDAFISCARFEPPGAQAHYSERLVTTPDNPVFLPWPGGPEVQLTREAAGLPASGALIGCLQTLFKFHPDFDATLSAIVRRDPDCHLVMPAGHEPGLTQALLRRWRERHPELVERVRLIGRVPSEHFASFCGLFDVLLDPLHFGSGLTFYLAASQGAPTVTFPGAFARGRVVAGLYEQMDCGGELVAADAEHYVRLALDLAHSPQRQADLRPRLREAARLGLYDHRLAVDQIGEAFLTLIAGGQAHRESSLVGR